MDPTIRQKYVRVQNRVPWPQRGRLPWATQQMTNDGRSFALPITLKKSVSKGFCSAFLFPIAGKSLL